jgi:hypothetical protein
MQQLQRTLQEKIKRFSKTVRASNQKPDKRQGRSNTPRLRVKERFVMGVSDAMEYNILYAKT